MVAIAEDTDQVTVLLVVFTGNVVRVSCCGFPSAITLPLMVILWVMTIGFIGSETGVLSELQADKKRKTRNTIIFLRLFINGLFIDYKKLNIYNKIKYIVTAYMSAYVNNSRLCLL
jgi:hypothetical protein